MPTDVECYAGRVLADIAVNISEGGLGPFYDGYLTAFSQAFSVIQYVNEEGADWAAIEDVFAEAIESRLEQAGVR